jgi:hypothetical protein
MEYATGILYPAFQIKLTDQLSDHRSALFILYEFMMSSDDFENGQILRSVEEISIGALTFAEASYGDRHENYPSDVLSPYLPYFLCQAAIVQHRLWKHVGRSIYKQRLDMLTRILQEFRTRWTVASE